MTPTMTARAPLEAIASDAVPLTSFLADLPVSVALFDCDLRYVAANAGWLAAFGISGEVPAGQRHDEVVPTGDPGLAELQQRVLAGEAIEHHARAGSTNGVRQNRIL